MRHSFMAVCLALALWGLVGVVACEKNTLRPPPTMAALSGWVRQGGSGVWAGVGLGGATVKATSSWGSDSTTTDGNGAYYGLRAAGDVVVSAEREGFSAQVKQLTVDRDQTVIFELQRVDTPGDPQGEYRLIITASPSCTTLPAEAMQRNYSARIDRTQDALVVSLRGADFVVGWGSGDPRFLGTRDGNTVHFEIGDDCFGPPCGVVENLSGGKQLGYAGTATGWASDTTIVAAFDGTVQVWTADYAAATLLAECQAKDHRLEFVR